MSTLQAPRPASAVAGRPEDLPWLLEHAPATAPILRHMMAAASVDERRVPAPAMADLERSCGGCGQKNHCANELGSGRATRSFVDYCPSAVTLLKLR